MKFQLLSTQKSPIIAVNWSAAGSGAFSTLLSSASLASALSIVGLPAAIPLGGVGGAFTAASSGLIIAGKKLDSKIKKHQEIVTLAIAKRDTVDRLLSKALYGVPLRTKSSKRVHPILNAHK